MSKAIESLVVTPAAVADIPSLVVLMQAFYAESGHALDADAARAAFGRLIGSPALGAVWIAHIGSEPVGHVVLVTRFAMEHGALAGCVDDLFVKPEYRRSGVGGVLLAALLTECASRQCQSLHVEVGADNMAARALYARFGLQAAQDGRVLMSGPLPASR